MEVAGKFFPAFEQVDGVYVQTPETEKVLGIMQENTEMPINVQAAPSVLTDIKGDGIWATGGGVYDPLTGGTYVDPIKGSVTVAAHEAAHQGFPSQLINDVMAQAKGMESLNMDFPQKRIQKFSPASGKPSINKTLTMLKGFADEAFTDDGQYNTSHQFRKLPSAKNCKWCEFKNKPELCDRRK